jgi:hypothetical protein
MATKREDDLGNEVLQREMARIRKYDDVKYVNLKHMEWLPDFGLFYLNIEQVVSLVVADLNLTGRWSLHDEPDNYDRSTLRSQFRANEKMHELFPKKLMRQLMRDVEADKLPHIKPPKRFESFLKDSAAEHAVPSEIYVSFDDLIEWLLSARYLHRRTLEGMAALLRYEEDESKRKAEILNYAQTIRIGYAVDEHGYIESAYEVVAKHFPGDRPAIKRALLNEARKSYAEKLERPKPEEENFREHSKRILLRIILALSKMKPLNLKGTHAVRDIKQQMQVNGHSGDDATVKKYLTEALALPRKNSESD